jgi:hypothetical protein
MGETSPPDASSVDTRLAIRASLDRLDAYLSRERLRGYDPYDGLTSPLFRLPVLRSARWPRLAAQQVVKRSSVNLRPLLAIPKGYNAVSVALALEGDAYRAAANPDRANALRGRAAGRIEEIAQLGTSGYSGACWGYPFDWQARFGTLPAGTPTIVATGIATNALFIAYRMFGLERAFELCASAVRFVVEDLPRTEDRGAFCWGYYPNDSRQHVLNATLKGARLCAQVFSVTGEGRYRDLAKRTVRYVTRHQKVNGAWPYAVGDTRTWADSFHTGYVLDALHEYQSCTGDTTVGDAMQRGWRYYRSAFFVDDRIPLYYPGKRYPVDATVVGQSLLTLCKLRDRETAERVGLWSIDAMQCDDGHFAYQVRRRGVVKIPYMRWSSAYMYVGLSRLERALAGEQL